MNLCAFCLSPDRRIRKFLYQSSQEPYALFLLSNGGICRSQGIIIIFYVHDWSLLALNSVKEEVQPGPVSTRPSVKPISEMLGMDLMD